MNATLRWTLPPDLLVLNYDDLPVTDDSFLQEEVTLGILNQFAVKRYFDVFLFGSAPPLATA
jgi:hypothetical protein